MRKDFVLGLVMMVLFNSGLVLGQALPDNTQDVVRFARRFLKKNVPDNEGWTIVQTEKQTTDSFSFYLIRLKPAGFIVISPGPDYQVWAFSFRHDFARRPDEQSVALALLHDISLKHPVEKEQKRTETEKTWGPYVHTLWGQVNCYDENGYLINVTNYYTPNHYAPGCVSISMSTLLHYYRWPDVGTGSYTYTDSRGDCTGTYSADFKNTWYKWEDMLDRYRYKRSTDKQRQAAGELVFQVSVSLSTNFESSGSSSNVNRIPSAGKNHFRFNGVERKPSSQSFWSMLNFNVSHRIPVILAVKNSKGGGHSIICDGLKIDENGKYYYHLNMGWWGTSNGWYQIHNSWNVQGYNTVTDGIFYFLPIPRLLKPVIQNGASFVHVKWRFPAKANAEAFELQQKLGSGSWKTLSDTLHDTLFRVAVHGGVNQYFRVRAKVAGRWPYNDWSNTEKVTTEVTGIPAHSNADGIRVVPNPVSGDMTIRFGDFMPDRLVIYNIFGQPVFTTDKIQGNTKYRFNVSFLPDGLYIIRLRNPNNQIRILKFIKD